VFFILEGTAELIWRSLTCIFEFDLRFNPLCILGGF